MCYQGMYEKYGHLNTKLGHFRVMIVTMLTDIIHKYTMLIKCFLKCSEISRFIKRKLKLTEIYLTKSEQGISSNYVLCVAKIFW